MDIYRDKLQRIYNHINFRCNNINCEFYARYGGRGIRNRFSTFKEFYDYTYNSFVEHVKIYGFSNTTIDRIDNNGDYCIGNLKWSTRKEQGSNRSTTIYFSAISNINGSIVKCRNIRDFSLRTGYNQVSIKEAINNNGTYKDYVFKADDIDELDACDISNIYDEFYNNALYITGYEIIRISDGVRAEVKNLKDAARKLGMDPSAAFKVAKGIRKSCNGYKINTIIITC